MSKDIKVGDWVRVKPGRVGQDNVEFQVTQVHKTLPCTWGTRYVEGDPKGKGIWFRFLEKITHPAALAYLNMPVGTQFKVHNPKINYTDPSIYTRTDTGYRSLNGNLEWSDSESDSELWSQFEIIPVEPQSTIVEDIATGVALQKISAYRKELIALLESSDPDARPIVQAKLSAVNEVLKRVNS